MIIFCVPIYYYVFIIIYYILLLLYISIIVQYIHAVRKKRFYRSLVLLIRIFPDFSSRLVESHFAAVEYLMDLLGHVSSGLSLYIARQSHLIPKLYDAVLYDVMFIRVLLLYSKITSTKRVLWLRNNFFSSIINDLTSFFSTKNNYVFTLNVCLFIMLLLKI